jgi:hypothetical protein
MENCTGTNSGENLGSPNCVETMKYANGFLMASLVDDAGADNYIPALTVVNDAYITARLKTPTFSVGNFSKCKECCYR